MIPWIEAKWPAPSHVRAGVTCRHGGHSQGIYARFNLADHVNDDPTRVFANRQHLKTCLQWQNEPCWLQQYHGNRVIHSQHYHPGVKADACYSKQPQQICVILTADCLPILLCDQEGTMVAAIHAGWRGLAAGIIANTIQAMQITTTKLLAWFGPAISQPHYEVGKEVYAAFPAAPPTAMAPSKPNHWQCSLHALAYQQLLSLGVNKIYREQCCTYSQPEQFYSYRRDGNTGRIASCIWLEQ